MMRKSAALLRRGIQTFAMHRAVSFKIKPFGCNESIAALNPSTHHPHVLVRKRISSNCGGDSKRTDLIDQLEEKAYKLLYVPLEEEDKQMLSALFMQATEGKCNVPDPGPEAKEYERLYWNGWKKLGDMTKEEAVQKYLKIGDKYI